MRACLCNKVMGCVIEHYKIRIFIKHTGQIIEKKTMMDAYVCSCPMCSCPM